MKRVLTILLLMGMLLSGCQTAQKEGSDHGLLLYFPSKNPHEGDGFITAEGLSGEEIPSIGDLIQMYFSAEAPEGGRPVMPTGWKFDSHGYQMDGLLVLYFTGETVFPIEESLAIVCMTRTFSQLPEIRKVKVYPPNHRDPITLSDNDLRYEDMAMSPQEELVLYFPDENLRYLRRETRLVDPVEEEQKPAYIIDCLLKGTADGEPNPCIPEGTRVLGIRVENGVCTLDLSSEFVRNMSNRFRTASLAVYSIVNSLTEIEKIRTVDIMVAHGPLDQVGKLNLSQGLQRNESLFAGNDGFDGSIYPYAVDSTLLVEVPVWIREDPELSVEEQLVRALLNYEGDHLVRHSIPKGTTLLSVRVAQNTCVVDLTAEFTDRAEDLRAQRLAVRSIVATLSSLPHVQAVEILVEGNRPQYYVNKLRDIRTVEESWFED